MKICRRLKTTPKDWLIDNYNLIKMLTKQCWIEISILLRVTKGSLKTINNDHLVENEVEGCLTAIGLNKNRNDGYTNPIINFDIQTGHEIL